MGGGKVLGNLHRYQGWWGGGGEPVLDLLPTQGKPSSAFPSFPQQLRIGNALT